MLLPAAWCLIGWVGQRWWRALCALVSTRPTTRIYGEAGSRCAARWRLPLHPPRWTDPAHGASRADGGAEHHSRWPPLHPLQCSGRRWQRAVVGRRQRAPLPRGLLFNPSGAAHGGGSGRWWDGSGQQWARPFSFLVFYSFENLFAESLKILTAHHCREHELQLTS
jgi:hypothetical protein